MKKLRLLLAAACGLSALALAPGRAAEPEGLDAPEPNQAAKAPPAGTRVLRDLAYGADPAQRMDVYLPTPTKPGAPVIVMVHGGGWRNGDKAARSVVENKAARWVPRGVIFISVGNRLLPEAQPLAQAEDVARAVAAAQRQAPQWGGDPAKFVLMGHSAGAHLIALLTSAPARARSLGAQPWLGAVALDSAALDVPKIMSARHMRLYDPAFGRDPNAWREVSPIHALTREAPPLLLVCSSRRSDSCGQAHAFAARSHELSVRAEVLEEDLSHREINVTLGLAGAYTDAVEAFMRSLDPALAAALPLR